MGEYASGQGRHRIAVFGTCGHGGQFATGEYVSGHGTHVVPAIHGRTGATTPEPVDALGVGTAVFDFAAALEDADALALAADVWFALNGELEIDVEHAARIVTASNVVGTSGLMRTTQRWIEVKTPMPIKRYLMMPPTGSDDISSGFHGALRRGQSCGRDVVVLG